MAKEMAWMTEANTKSFHPEKIQAKCGKLLVGRLMKVKGRKIKDWERSQVVTVVSTSALVEVEFNDVRFDECDADSFAKHFHW